MPNSQARPEPAAGSYLRMEVHTWANVSAHRSAEVCGQKVRR